MGKSSTGKSKSILRNISNNSQNEKYMKKVSHLTGCRQVYDNRISRQPGRGTLVITQPTTEDIGEFSSLCPTVSFGVNSHPKNPETVFYSD